MWKTCVLASLALQLHAAMAVSVRPSPDPLTTTCNTVRCGAETVCRIVLDPKTQRVGPRCISRRDLPSDNLGGCSVVGGPLLTVTSAPVYGPSQGQRERYSTYRCRRICPAGLVCNNVGVCCAPGPLTPGPKLGECPATSPGDAFCVIGCDSDLNCDNNLKCCPTACPGSRLCTTPKYQAGVKCADINCTSGSCQNSPEGPICIDFTVPAEKGGQCFPLPFLCPPPPRGVFCRIECDNDFHCPGDQKCCSTCTPLCKQCFAPNITTPPPPFLCDKPCAPGHECVDTGIRCIRAPCPAYQCVPVEPCSLPPETGPCEALDTRYYYDASGPRPGCRTFTYGGCGGNSNNFRTLRECLRACVGNHRDGSYDA